MSPFEQFAHLRIPLQDIMYLDDLFVIGGSGNKAQLLQHGQLIDVCSEVFVGRDKEFWTDIAMRSSLSHANLLCIVGFCDFGYRKMVINKYEVNGSLKKNIRNPNLTWLQRLHICIGVARALCYIHYDSGRGYDVIHRDIKSSNVMLDENWDAKVFGFGLSIKNSATWRHRLVLDAAVGTRGYLDPVNLETGTVTHKSDVYSFGVVLFEVLSGRLALFKDTTGKIQSLAQMATRHYEDGKLDEIIAPYLKNQMHPQSFKIFSDTAYHCLKKDRAQRPDMEKVAKRLEKAWELQRKHENPARLKPPVVGLSPNLLKEKTLDHMKIPLADIELATESFSETYCIGSGGYGMVYKAELDHFDSDCATEIEGKSKSEFPRRRSTVAIKRIRADGQGEQSFYSEIALLTRCKHPNVVSLLGFCDDDAERILVYEHAFYGSLDDYLGNTDNMITFTWVQRIQLCLNIANGLNYLHGTTEEKQMIVHRDIKSANILLGKNWEAKIADFGLSRIQHANNQASTLNTYNIAGTEVYLDPEYFKTGKLKKESDIYSFGVVLFEILCGRLAYDEYYYVDNDKGLPSTVRRFLNEGILKEIVDPTVMRETDMNSFTLNRGPNQDSLDAFLKIAYQCLAETRVKRPTLGIIIAELEKALYFQENNKDKLKLSLEDIKLATQNFSDHNLIGTGRFGNVYKGEVTHANQHHVIAAKRLDRKYGQGEAEFSKELKILLEYKNDNVIGLVGYCDELGEKIIVYEHAAHKSLDLHLSSTELTWMKRLKICIDVASGLEFLHGHAVTQDAVIHGNIKSSNILLTVDWKAKITDFGRSVINKEMDLFNSHVVGTPGYCDPSYKKIGLLTNESDMYSLGVVLYEILCGRRAYDDKNHKYFSLFGLVIEHVDKGKIGDVVIEDIVFMDIKEQIMPESLTTYSRTVFQCLHRNRKERPTAGEVVLQLKQALEFQEDHEIWDPKLPGDYKEIIQMSESPSLYSAMSKKDLHNKLCKGILLQDRKVCFSLGSNGERNEMISARKFSYENRRSHKWRAAQVSRFQNVAEMSDISNLKIQIKITTQFLSPHVNYGVYLIFRFCNTNFFSSNSMYVNLEYKKGGENLHAYFATWRDKEWMMIELWRFLNHSEDTKFEVLLESLSRYYCRSGAIHFEGIEFRAINNVEHEETEKTAEVRQVPKSILNQDQVQKLPSDTHKMHKASENDGETEKGIYKLLLSNEVNGKKHLMLSAKEVLFNSSTVKPFHLKPSAESRFQEVIELPPQQVFRIYCKIQSKMFSPDTQYVCYLVFKLSEKCSGLHCPVKVRNLLHRNKKEVEILYFRSPRPWNLHDTNYIPKQREDGWMEVKVWKFNSNRELKNDFIRVNLKLISYEGTMCNNSYL